MNGARGLSLIELMVVLGVIAVLAAVGYPLYTAQTEKARRYDAQGVLLALANQLEQHRAAQPNLGYTGFVVNDFSELWGSTGKYYDFVVQLNDAAPFSYGLEAQPKAAQAGDACGTLSLDAQGTRSAATDKCWK